MARRFINSPGVQVTEIDASLRRSDLNGTNVYLVGFANKGPIYEVTSITSVTEFEEIFGKPTCDAERYFYHNVRYVLQTSTATLTVCRIPYTVNPEDDKYSVLVYPVIPVKYEDPLIVDEWEMCAETFIEFDQPISSILEGDTISEYTVALSRTRSSGVATVDYTTSNNSTSGTVTFAPGILSSTLSIPISGDTINESNENISITLSNPTTTSGIISITGVDTHTVTLTDDDPSDYAFAQATSQTVEGDVNNIHTVTVTRTGTAGTGRVDCIFTDDTAANNTDYVGLNQQLIFNDGDTSKTLPIGIIGDTIPEEDSKTFTITLSNAVTQYGIPTIVSSSDTHQVIITNDDHTIIGFNTASTLVSEDVGTLSVPIVRDETNGTATVQCKTSNGTALSGSDYTAVDNLLTFADGVSSVNIDVSIADDNANENAEGLSLVLSAPSAQYGNATLGTVSHSISITDNDTTSINFTGTTNTVSESADSVSISVYRDNTNGTASIDYSTGGGTAVTDIDYTTSSGTITFEDGQQYKSITIPILQDLVPEGSETFEVTLTNPVAEYGDISLGSPNTHTVTITDDDVATIQFASAIAHHCNEGEGVLLTVKRSVSGGEATVDYTTVDGTAVSPTDYTAVAGTITFPEGSTSEDIFISTTDDSINENSKAFTVVLSNPTATVGNVTLGSIDINTITIADDDASSIGFSSSSTTVAEGDGSVDIVISRTLTSGSASVRYTTSGGTATYGADYTGVSNRLVEFADGESTKTISIPILPDILNEESESFNVVLSDAIADVGSINLGISTHSITITDDDTPSYSFRASGQSISEGDTGSTTVTIPVDRVGTNGTGSVDYIIDGGTADPGGDDYTASSGTLSFADGEDSKDILVTITGDKDSEDNETFNVTLSNPVTQYGTTSITGTNPHVVTILNDDHPSPICVRGIAGTGIDSQASSLFNGTYILNESESTDDKPYYVRTCHSDYFIRRREEPNNSNLPNAPGDYWTINGYVTPTPDNGFDWSEIAYYYPNSPVEYDDVTLIPSVSWIPWSGTFGATGTPTIDSGICSVATDALCAWWKFDGDFTDSIGNFNLTPVTGGEGTNTAAMTPNTTGAGGSPLDSYMNLNEFTDVTAASGVLGTDNYRYLKSTDADLYDIFKHDSDGFTVSFWVKTEASTPQNANDQLKTMDIFTVGNAERVAENTDGTSYRGFKIQLACTAGTNLRNNDTGDDDNEWYLAVNLGPILQAYADSKRCKWGTPQNWEQEGFANDVIAGELSDGNWHQVVVTYDPNRQSGSQGASGYGAAYTLLVYVDGVRWNSKGHKDKHLDWNGGANNWLKKEAYHVGYGSTGADETVVTIGDQYPLNSIGDLDNNGGRSTAPFSGQLADVRVYNKPLTDGIEDINNLTAAETDTRATAALSGSEIHCLWNNGTGDLDPGTTYTC